MSINRRNLFQRAGDPALRISESERVMRQLQRCHRAAYYVQKEHLWRCGRCGKTAVTATGLAGKICRR